MKIVRHDALRKEILSRLMDDQSPQAIAGYVSGHMPELPPISKNAVYRFIRSPYGRKIEAYRRTRQQKRRRRRMGTRSLSDRTFIDKRPKKINARLRTGDAEADFIVSGKSGKGILLTVTDRKVRVTFLETISTVTIGHMHKAFVRIKRRFPEMKTVTTDNDLLFARHQQLAILLNVKIYFCHPYHSWEKGSIENVNGVIRRDIPKGSDLSRYSKHFIKRLEQKLNRRPMKCLGYRTPQEALERHRNRIKNKKHPD